MNISRVSTIAFVTATLACASGLASANGIYGTAFLGWSSQSGDSQAYGENLAIDPTFPEKFDSGDGGLFALGLGYRVNDTFRIEARLGARKGDFDSGKFGAGERAGQEFVLNGSVESKTLTVEMFYDIPTTSTFKPYIKAGVGVSRNDYSARLGGSGVAGFFDSLDGTVDGFYDDYADQSSSEFAWTVGFGATKAIGETVNLVLEYQYISLGYASTAQDDFTDGFEVDASANELLIGLRVGF